MSDNSSAGVAPPASRCRLYARGDGAELTGGRRIQEPCGQDALVDDGCFLHSYALDVEGLRTQAAHAQGIVDDADILGKQLLAETVFQETGLSRDRRTIHRADQMADDRSRHPRIEHD